MTVGAPVWVSGAEVIRSDGNVTVFDPGVGNDRYQRALSWLREAGASIGLASFTFDPEEAGSVVLAPEQITTSMPEVGDSSTAMETIDDGIDDWDRGFREMMSELDAGTIQKVVLARRMSVRLHGQVDLDRIVEHLVAQSPGTHVFSIAGLVGASPELMASVTGGVVVSEVLAGTAATPGMLTGGKTDLEHRLAAESVRGGLAGLVDRLESETSIVEAGGLAHRATTFRGKLIDGHTVMEVLTALHPSAAVAGTPREPAMRTIRRVEAGSRGRYAAPVGWFDAAGNGRFALALRCGQIDGDLITLYAGGGLVGGSDHDQELDETELKLRPMLSALGAAAPQG